MVSRQSVQRTCAPGLLRSLKKRRVVQHVHTMPSTWPLARASALLERPCARAVARTPCRT
eukprot:7221608-Pyramimonas_sp.AAC.1